MSAEPTNRPASQSADEGTEHEPVVTGTLFFMFLLLLIIFGLWVLMYAMLYQR